MPPVTLVTCRETTNGGKLARMAPALVILTGASGSGKTTLARAVQHLNLASCEVLFFDSVGVPSEAEMRAFGDGHEPGGAWQRATTIRWIERIAILLQGGTAVLLEGQMRIAFIHEALAMSSIRNAHIVLVDCDDVTRAKRLRTDRNQPGLANPDMMSWSRYLREEATSAGCEIMNTGESNGAACRDRIATLLTAAVTA
jgi:energy-coupling factor transporter ATP-binding protein EcfA2